MKTTGDDTAQPEPRPEFKSDSKTLRSSTSFSSAIANIFSRSSTSNRSNTAYSDSSFSGGSETLCSNSSFTSGSATLCSTSSHANDNNSLCSTSKPSANDGLSTWYNNPDATVDICFVHGRYGDQNTTWTAEGQASPWPRQLLPSRLPQARLLTYDYDALDLRESNNWPENIPEVAAGLLAELTRGRASRHASYRPLILVAHDVGGLVCKESILLSRDSPSVRLRSLADCVRGVVSMGTPHGAVAAEECELVPLFSALGLYALAGLRPPGDTPAGGAYLGALEDEFNSMVGERVKGRQLRAACFYAELPSPGMGWMVVPRGSAAPEGYYAVGVHADQKGMARFASPEENGFKRLFGELGRWVRGVESGMPKEAVVGGGKLERQSKDAFGGSELSCVEGSEDGEVAEIWLEDGAGAETWSTGRTTLFGGEEEQRPLKDDIS